MKTSLLLFLLLPVVTCQADFTPVRTTVFRGTDMMTVEVPFVAGATESIHLNASFEGKDLAIGDIYVSDVSVDPRFLAYALDFSELPSLDTPPNIGYYFPNKAWRTNANDKVSFATISWTFAQTEPSTNYSKGEIPIYIEINYGEAERNIPGNALNATFSYSPGPVPRADSRTEHERSSGLPPG